MGGFYYGKRTFIQSFQGSDQFERFVEKEDFTGVTFSVDVENKVAKAKIPKARTRSDEPPTHICDGKYTNMYFSKGKNNRYSFCLTVNLPLFKKMGEDGLVDEFRQCVRTFLGSVNGLWELGVVVVGLLKKQIRNRPKT